MTFRLTSSLLLTALCTAFAWSQPVAKEPSKEPPALIDGKDVQAWVKLLTDTDPANRQRAILALERFPAADVRKLGGKTILRRLLGGEDDSFIRLGLMDLVGAIGGFDDATDMKDGIGRIARSANEGQGIVRLHALNSLARFGNKAHDQIKLVTSAAVADDSSFEVRHALAQTIGAIGASETNGPSIQALKILSKTLAEDKCAMVRLAALQSLISLGPPWSAPLLPGAKGPPMIDDKAAKETITQMKVRIGAIKGGTGPEPDKQLECWCRLVIIRFGGPTDLEEQIAGLSRYLMVKISDHAMAGLKSASVSPSVLAKLTALKDKEFIRANFLRELSRLLSPEELKEYQELIVSHGSQEIAVRLQALEILSMLGDSISPRLDLILSFLDDKELILRLAAVKALGAVGEKGGLALVQIISDPKQELPMRLGALDSLALLGEKADIGRDMIVSTIIKNPANIKDQDGVSLIQHALITLGSMGVKAKTIIPDLQDLIGRVTQEKVSRLHGQDYQKWLTSPEVKKFLDKLTPEEKKKLLEDTIEDRFILQIQDAIRFIQESSPGHPGGEKKK